MASAPSDQELEWFLAGLRQHESGSKNVPNAGGHSTASGYYQYTNGTWNNYKGYKRAMDAPFSVQHERARRDIAAAYKRYGGDWERVAMSHFYPAWANKPKSQWNRVPAPGNPTGAQFVRSVMSQVSKASSGQLAAAPSDAGSSGSGGGGGAVQAAGDDVRPAMAASDVGAVPSVPSEMVNASDEEIEQYLRRNYGYLSWTLDVPELREVILQASREGWDEARIRGALFNTDWWAKHSRSIREWDALRGEDPAEAARRTERRAQDIQAMAGQLGLKLTDAKVREIAEASNRYGWSEQELRNALTAEARRNPPAVAPSGDIAATEQWVRDQAYAYLSPYGIVLPDSQIRDWALGIRDKTRSEEGLLAALRNRAINANPNIAPFLEAGLTPREAKARLDTVQRSVLNKATQLGISMTEDEARSMAHQVVLRGWSDQQITTALVDRAPAFSPGMSVGGTLGERTDRLVQKSRQWLVPISGQTAYEWALRIESGEITQEAFDTWLTEQALSRFPQLRSQIESGVNPGMYFDPYRQQVAQLLEITPDSIDFLGDPRWGRILDHAPEGGGERRPMTLWETQEYVRGLPEYGQTRQGMTQAAQLGEEILRSFGAVAR